MPLMWRCAGEANSLRSAFNAFSVHVLSGGGWREGDKTRTQNTFYMTPYPTQKQRGAQISQSLPEWCFGQQLEVTLPKVAFIFGAIYQIPF